MAVDWRTIRVFISSTFRDMQAEREELVKRIFPQLRKLCEQRGVTWGEVDLRWGVTDEQKAEGKVLPICLEEIQNCRPYFIGLLGERYGWIPDEISQDLAEREPWLAKHRDHSVTELEILHGVLNNPDMADHAFFYFRSPAFIDTLPDVQKDHYWEIPSQEEVDKYGPEQAEKYAAERRRKLVELKARIRASGFPVRSDYPDPRSLAELVLNDLSDVIGRCYPADSQPDPLDREAAGHEAFAASRARIYIPREEYFQRLDSHVNGNGHPLIILGESGCGKSAMLANWALRYRERIMKKDSSHDQLMLLMHFIGASPYSTDWALMLRRIMGEFKRFFHISDDIPDRSDELRSAFANWLNMAAARGRIILILDGLNQLEDRDSALDLTWLPPHIPANIRLILSTLPGRPLDELKKRGWATFDVKPLDKMERRNLTIQYLGSYRKSLSQTQLDRIVSQEQTSNPLYLRVLLEELRLYGEHETIDERIQHYLAAYTVDELYSRVLRRYEEDYEREYPGLVGNTFSTIWASRRGLSEVEILELLGQDGEPLPRAYWSPLYLAAESSLVSRSGLIGFGHDYLREAVRKKFLPTEEIQSAAHLRLADYFDNQEIGPRKLDELPWQLDQACAWQMLYDLLAQPEFFPSVWKTNQFELKAYWTHIENNSKMRMVNACRPMLNRPEKYKCEYLWCFTTLLTQTGHPVEALLLSKYLIEKYRKNGDKASLQGALGNCAIILQMRGEIDKASKLCIEQEIICRELGNMDGLQTSLGNHAVILRLRGDLDGALKMHREEEKICRELGNMDGIQISLGNQAVILQLRGDLDGALKMHREEEKICRELGNMDGLARSFNNQALILEERGDLDGAMELHKEQEKICRELGNIDGLAKSFNNQAIILGARGDLDRAIELHKEQEKICRELGNMDGLANSLGEQGLILRLKGELKPATKLLEEQEKICRDLGDREGLARCLGNEAIILGSQGENKQAIRLLKEQEKICRELKNMDVLQASLGNQGAMILQTRGDFEEALHLLKEQESICRDLGNRDGLANCLGNQALILAEIGDVPQAMDVLEIAQNIWSELDNPEGRARCIVNKAVFMAKYRREMDQASTLATEAYEIAVRYNLSALASQIKGFLEAISKSR